MPVIPTSDEDALRDAFWFLIAPITTAPMLVYSSAGYVTGDYPLGKPDWGASARNSVMWAAMAASVYGWNLMFSPQNAVWMSGTSAFKVAGHLALGSVAPIVAATVLAATPVAMVANMDDPDQGRQLQSAATGQPGVGSWTAW